MNDAFPVIFTASLFVGLFVFLFSFFYIRVSDHVRGSFIFIPALTVITTATCAALEVPFSAIVVVDSILFLAEVLYFYGPFRVVGWAWPKGGKRKVPPLVLKILICVATVVTILVTVLIYHSYSSYPFSGSDDDALMLVFQAPILWVASYGLAWGLYAMLLGCFSFDQEDKTGVLKDSWMDGHNHIIRFDSDTNGYHVSPKLYEEFTMRRKGLTYSYTLVTGLGGQQFIRNPPLLVSPVPTWGHSAYDHVSADSAPPDNHDFQDIPEPRLLGGDAPGSAYDVGRLFPG